VINWQSYLIVLLTSICSISTSLLAQDIEIESKEVTVDGLLKSLSQATNATSKYYLTRDLYYVFINDDIDRAIDYMNEALDYAVLSDDISLLSYAYSDLGHAYMKKGDFSRALNYTEISSDYIKSNNLVDLLRFNEFNYGLIYSELQLYSIAKNHFRNALDEFENERNKWLASYEITKANLALGDTNIVRSEIERLYNDIPENNGQVNTDYLYHYLVSAEIYSEIGNTEKADRVISRIRPYVEKHNRRYYLGILHLTTSNIHLAEGNYRKALEEGSIALDYFTRQQENSYTLKSLLKLSKVNKILGEYTTAYDLQSQYYNKYSEIDNHHQKVIANQLQSQSNATFNAEEELQRTNELLVQRQYYNLALVILLSGVLILLVLVFNSSKERNKTAKQLAKINQDKDHFIGVVSHDLRSPLNSIMMLSSLINSDPEDVDTDSLKEYSSIIFNSSRRMEYLINNMLDANKIETGTTKIALKPTSLNNSISAVIDGIKILGADKDINTELNLPDHEITILSEYNALVRVLENLISNAYKFSPPGSTVTISANDVDQRAYFDVSDQGPGLTQLDKTKLFHKFEKLSASPTGNEKQPDWVYSLLRIL
tara:strand:- start:31699 stop:33498 length:1800 start_codon:yes stop_codon:yes gene_type:complete